MCRSGGTASRCVAKAHIPGKVSTGASLILGAALIRTLSRPGPADRLVELTSTVRCRAYRREECGVMRRTHSLGLGERPSLACAVNGHCSDFMHAPIDKDFVHPAYASKRWPTIVAC
jgi:hypothetical protein